jgi:Arc/MetJ-type ribon-helix-helix transcriptional regulator
MVWTKTKMRYISLLLPEGAVKELDRLVEERFFPSRTEAIRAAIYIMLFTISGYTENKPVKLKVNRRKLRIVGQV